MALLITLPVLLTGRLCVWIALLLISQSAAAIDEPRWQVQLGYWLPAKIKLDEHYNSWHEDGAKNVEFQQTNGGVVEPFPYLLIGFRTSENSWIEADYLGFETRSTGKIKKHIQAGPLRFFVSAHSRESYKLDIGRIWYRYRIHEDDSELSVMFGLTAVQATARVSTEALGQTSAEGILPMPGVGLLWKGSGLFGVQWALTGDYSAISATNANASIWNLAGSLEKQLNQGFSAGLGLKHFQFRLSGQRTKYNAAFKESISEPFVFIRYSYK